MNDWSEEQRIALLSVLEQAVVELKRAIDLVQMIVQTSTRTYVSIGPDGFATNNIYQLTAVEREEFERVQGERPEGERYRLVGIPERMEDR